METVKIGDTVCAVKRSGRKTVCIRVTDVGEAEILAPYGLSSEKIAAIFGKYGEKLAVECEKRIIMASQRDAFFLDYGSSVRWLGEKRILVSEETDGANEKNMFCIPANLHPEEIRSAVIAKYKSEAVAYISQRVKHISQQMGLSPIAVKINSAKSHWASCSRKKSLNFSYFCMMAEPRAVDYIIIHELCHMLEFNHSSKFWAQVEKQCPEYKLHKRYLSDLWKEIRCEMWE